MTNCEIVSFRKNSTSIPRTIITSFPGSGNTWFRHLIHTGSGYYTGSIYNDGKLIARGFKGEQLDWSDNRTVGIKIHQYGSASKLAHKMHKTAGEVFPKTLLIVRSPFKAILSEFNRLNNPSHSHTGEADEKLFKDGTFLNFLELQLPRWGRSIAKWMNDYRGEVQTVCYENLKENTSKVLKKSLEFMEVPFLRPECIEQAEQKHGYFKRKSKNINVTKMIKDEARLQHMAEMILNGVRSSFKRKNLEDCTVYF